VKKKIFIVFVGIGVVFFVLLSFLPNFLSSDVVLHKFLTHINDQSEAQLQVGDCSLGWQQGVVCVDVEYSLPRRGIHITADQVSGTQGLLAILAAPKNIGTVRVLHPVVTFSEQALSNIAHLFSSLSSETPVHSRTRAMPVPSDFVDKEIPFWEIFAGTLMIEEGRAVVKSTQDAQQGFSAGIFSGSAALAAGTVQYELQGIAGDGIGKLSGKGFVNLPARRQNILDTLVIRLRLEMSDLQLAPLLRLLHLNHDVPEGSALLSGKLTMIGAGRDSLDVVGNINCSDIELTGGVLGADHPRVQELSVFIDGKKKGRDDWRIARLDIEGDPGTFFITSEFEKNDGHARITGTLNLPVFLAQFPHLLQVQPESLVKNGELIFFTELTRNNSRQDFILDLAINDLQGTYQNKLFSWDNFANLSLKTEQYDGDFLCKRINFSSSFLQVTGKGDLDDFSLQLDADLEKASQELGQVFILPWSGKGNITLQATSGFGSDNGHIMDFQLQSSNFSLAKDGRMILPEYPVQLSGRISVPEAWLQDQERADIQLDGSCWPGNLSLTLHGMSYSDQAVTAGYEVSTRLNLERCTDFLQFTQILPENTTLTGNMTLDAAGFFTQDQVIVRELDFQVVDFENIRGERNIREKELALQLQRPSFAKNTPVGIRKLLVVDNISSWQAQGYGLSGYDRVSQRIFIRDFGLRSSSMQLNVNELVIEDSKDFSQSWYADLDELSDITPREAGKMVREEIEKVFSGLFAGNKP
jgi:hypothetical protein